MNFVTLQCALVTLCNALKHFAKRVKPCHIFVIFLPPKKLENVEKSENSEKYIYKRHLTILTNFFQTLPFATGQALARGILDSLMSTTYFNASALRLIRSWVTGGATIELELALAEGAGLRGGYSTPDSLKRRDRFKMEKIDLKGSVFEYVHCLLTLHIVLKFLQKVSFCKSFCI